MKLRRMVLSIERIGVNLRRLRDKVSVRSCGASRVGTSEGNVGSWGQNGAKMTQWAKHMLYMLRGGKVLCPIPFTK